MLWDLGCCLKIAAYLNDYTFIRVQLNRIYLNIHDLGM